MYKKWYKKLLLSYLPVLFALSMFIICIFSIITSQVIKQEAKKANRVYIEHVSQMLDSGLAVVEENLIHGLFSPEVEHYINLRSNLNPYVVSADLSDMLRNMVNANTLLQSVYVYKEEDNTIISSSHKDTLDRFPDQEFIRRAFSQEGPDKWSDVRFYQAVFGESAIPVVSIVRRITGYNGERGILVANVSTFSIQRYLAKYAESRGGFFRIEDTSGQNIMNTVVEEHDQKRELSVIESTHTNWTYTSGIIQGNWWIYFNIVSYVWLIVIGFGIIFSLGFVIYMTKRNYKPIDSLLSQIDTYMLENKSSPGLDQDEFGFIRNALDTLIEETTNYKKIHNEGVNKQNKLQIRDWLEDNTEIQEDAMKWLTRHFSDTSQIFLFILIEIDKYGEMQQEYKARDINLFKYVLEASISEMASHHSIRCLSNWFDAHRIGVMIQLDDNETEGIPSFAEQYLEWIRKNLPFTVTIGLSTEHGAIQEFPEAYQEALASIKYKLVVGDNGLIYPEQVTFKERHHSLRHIELIIAISRSMRLGEISRWKEHLEDLMNGLASDYSSSDDIIGVLRYLHYYLYREANLMPEDQGMYCKDKMLPQIDELISRMETLSDFYVKLLQLFEESTKAFASLREDNKYDQLVRKVEEFIGSNHHDPDFSLTLISDVFNVKSNTISKLFKEVTGQNFVDYLHKTRIEQAKQLLIQEPDVPIQNIGVRVGYLHAKTFIRLFKKEIGVTPGEFRRHSDG